MLVKRHLIAIWVIYNTIHLNACKASFQNLFLRIRLNARKALVGGCMDHFNHPLARSAQIIL